MKTAEQIQEKIDELQEELDGLESTLTEEAEDRGLEEMTPEYERLEAEYKVKEKTLEEQIKLLEWVLGE